MMKKYKKLYNFMLKIKGKLSIFHLWYEFFLKEGSE